MPSWSAHAARHKFASNIALFRGAGLAVVRAALASCNGAFDWLSRACDGLLNSEHETNYRNQFDRGTAFQPGHTSEAHAAASQNTQHGGTHYQVGELPKFLSKDSFQNTSPLSPPSIREKVRGLGWSNANRDLENLRQTFRLLAAKVRIYGRFPQSQLYAAAIVALMALVGLLVHAAQTSAANGGRNPAADAIAERFSIPLDTPLDERALDARLPKVPPGLSQLAGLESRLSFLPRVVLVFGRPPETSPSPSPSEAAATGKTPAIASVVDAAALSGAVRFDPLAVVVFRNLPEGSTFSSGARFSPNSWAVAEGDLKNLVVSLAGPPDQRIWAEIEVLNPSGVSTGVMHLEVRRTETGEAALARPSTEGAGTNSRKVKLPDAEPAVKPTPAVVEKPEPDDEASEPKPRRSRATHKRKGGKKAAPSHRASRPDNDAPAPKAVKPAEAQANTGDGNKAVKAVAKKPAEAPAAPSSSPGPGVVLTGISTILSNFGIGPTPPAAAAPATLAPKTQ